SGQRDRAAMAGDEELVFPRPAAAPHRSDGVDHVAGGEPTGAGHAGVAGRAAAEPAALLENGRPAGPVDGPVDAAAPEERGVRRVHDGVDALRRDVALHQLDLEHGPLLTPRLARLPGR